MCRDSCLSRRAWEIRAFQSYYKPLLFVGLSLLLSFLTSFVLWLQHLVIQFLFVQVTNSAESLRVLNEKTFFLLMWDFIATRSRVKVTRDWDEYGAWRWTENPSALFHPCGQFIVLQFLFLTSHLPCGTKKRMMGTCQQTSRLVFLARNESFNDVFYWN